MKIAGALFILIFAAFFLWPGICSGRKRVVEQGSSIHDQVQLAHPFDTIVVKKGLYRANRIFVDKPLWILGEGYPVIDAGGGDEIFIVTADSAYIAGFELRNVGVSFLHEPAAIRLTHVSHAVIRDNRINQCFFGIYLQYAVHARIESNDIRGAPTDEAHAGNAIHVWKGDSITVLHNRVEQHRDGIYFEFVNHSLIADNESVGNMRYGLHFMFSNDDVYHGNVFRQNGAGVAVMFSRNITMERNTFEYNWGGSSYGILLKEISHGVMRRNTFRANTVGIYAEGATAIRISDNDFTANGKAIDMKGNSLDNVVTRNNFLSNTFEVYTNTRSNRNTYDGNYWSQYEGYDLDRDGVGDVPYRPVNLMALVTNEVSAAYILLHSFVAEALDGLEKLFPQMIPETLVDAHPSMTPLAHD